MITFLLCNVIALWIGVFYLSYRLHTVEAIRVSMYAKMADPQKIEEDFEKSAAYVDQMLAPRRTTAPRTDQQGPPARVHKPKQNGPLPAHLKKK